MYDVRAIGNWFLKRAEQDGEQLSAMKLQKLAYVAHGWYLALTDKPLVHDAVEAWQWGPVFRSLYREFQEFGSQNITRRATAFDGATLVDKEISIQDYDDPDPESMNQFLESAWRVYGNYSAGELSNITHQSGTPWQQMFEGMGNQIKPYTVIPNEMIASHYKELLNERETSASSASSAS